MKHAHYEIVKVLADDHSLGLMFKSTTGEWKESDLSFPLNDKSIDYYLCRPKHIDACLHWLNGGAVECRFISTNAGKTVDPIENFTWSSSVVFMREELSIEPVIEYWVLYDTQYENLMTTKVYDKKPTESARVIALKVELPK